MSSPNDNIALRDGSDNPISMRAKDTSTAQDGSLQTVRHLASAYPVDYGIGGCFHTTVKSGSMAAGLSSNSPILTFRNPSTILNALVRRIKLNAWTLGTGFSAGLATFEMYVARSFTAMDTGGSSVSLTAPQAKLRTAMAAPSSAIQFGSTGALTAGTRTLDTLPIEAWNMAAPTGAYTGVNPLVADRFFEKLGSDHPLLLAQNEGFVIRATVPATGLWSWSAAVEWDEVPLVNY